MADRSRTEHRTPYRVNAAARVLVVSLSALIACAGESAPPGKILVRNDIMDKEYNVVTVDDVATRNGPTGFRATLKPGEKVVIPKRGITRLRFSRRYRDHTKVYLVSCPGSKDEGIAMKLIDVHTGRLNGGCSLARKGRRIAGSLRWDD